jgi:hypothetical protein
MGCTSVETQETHSNIVGIWKGAGNQFWPIRDSSSDEEPEARSWIPGPLDAAVPPTSAVHNLPLPF